MPTECGGVRRGPQQIAIAIKVNLQEVAVAGGVVERSAASLLTQVPIKASAGADRGRYQRLRPSERAEQTLKRRGLPKI
jgi:hypothetical protein